MLNIVFEHKDWLVVVKPAGLNFHSEDGDAGFVAQLEKQVNDKLWPVHRLDKLTSGLLLVAKSKESCRVLSELFAQRLVEKYYLAVCPSSMKKKQGLIKGDMSPARRGAFKLLKTQDNPAVTQFLSVSLMPGYRLCLLKPKTGKTHQLRVAMKSLGAPIVGDSAYGGTESDRLNLHSYVLGFEYEQQVFKFKHLPEPSAIFDRSSLENVLKEQNWVEPWSINWPVV
ncbi:MAG: tRNA pseudouridine32 synthase/23S rRNA pseudouridine746 synthase [Oceanicoccus sp.]